MNQSGLAFGNIMYVGLCVLLIFQAVLAQGPGPSVPPSAGPNTYGPSAPTPTGASTNASNPWQELLSQMMVLMKQAGPPNCPDCVGQKTDPAGNPQYPVEQVPPSPPQPQARPPPQQARPPPPPSTPVPAPVIADCFWEGRYYKPGSDIVRGQHANWCYVTYCDNMGKIQFWDDYNCPPNSMKPTSGHNEGRGAPGPNAPPAGGPQGGGGGGAVARAGGAGGAGGARGAAAGGARGGKADGCNHKGIFYKPGQEISSHRVGERCYGTYCSHASKVVNWEDWCTEPTTAAPTPPQARGGGGRGGRGGRGKAGGGRGGKGGGKRKGGAGGGGGGAGRRGGGSGGRGGGAAGRGGGAGGAGRGGGKRGGKRLQGCYHNGMYYQPNEDVVVGNIGDLCYGYYCEGSNTFVHWEDQCANNPAVAAPAAPAPAQPAVGGFFFK